MREGRREAGFTLLELLVALVLLSLLALGALELLRLAERAGATTPAEPVERAELRLFLASRLARALPVPAGEGLAVSGDSRDFRFVFAPLPEDPAGGLRVGEIVLEPAEGGVRVSWREASMALSGDPFAPLAERPLHPLARLPAGSILSYLLHREGREEIVVRGRIGPQDPWPLALRLGPPTPRDPLDLLVLPLRTRALSDCAAGRVPCG